MENSNRAFTVTELILVIAMLAILGGILAPALAATHDRSSRAACQFNLRQIALEATRYAGDNNDTVLPAENNRYSIAFPASLPMTSFGMSTNGAGIWSCPNRPALPSLIGNQWLIGYQYYGGITNWISNLGFLQARSPVKLSQSKPYWMLAADVIAQPDGVNWGGTNFTGIWAELPAHHTADSLLPQGGNEVFCDGSVQWIEAEKMYDLHTAIDPIGPDARPLFFYQDLSNDPYWIERLPAFYRAGTLNPFQTGL